MVLPDPSLLRRGLDKLIGATFLGSASKHPSASFRIASFKLERQLEYRATAVDIEDYAYLILGELEAAQLSQPPASQPKVARLDGHGGNHDNADKDKGKGKGKGKSEKPCWGWRRHGMSLWIQLPLSSCALGPWPLLGVWLRVAFEATVPVARARGRLPMVAEAKAVLREALVELQRVVPRKLRDQILRRLRQLRQVRLGQVRRRSLHGGPERKGRKVEEKIVGQRRL